MASPNGASPERAGADEPNCHDLTESSFGPLQGSQGAARSKHRKKVGPQFPIDIIGYSPC